MANIKSAKKRIHITARRRLRNQMIKSSTKTAIKKVLAAKTTGDAEATKAAFISAVSAIDRASSKGVYHKNNAARKKSRLAKLVNSSEA